MSEYSKGALVSKPDDQTERIEASAVNQKRMSRRNFIHNAAIGVVAAGSTLALKGGSSVLAQSQDAGDITLDAIMLTYIGAPIGTSSTSAYTIAKQRTNTFRVTAARSRSLRIKPEITLGPFTVGGTSFTQANSSQVSDAIMLRNSTTTTVTTPAPGIRENSMILGLREPDLHLSGDSSVSAFKFNRSNAEFALTIADLESDLRNGTGFKPDTIRSFLSQYVTDPALLVKPRFKLKKDIELSANSNTPFSQTKANGSTHSESKTSVFSTEIIRSFGFSLPFFKATFEVTARLEFTATSVQEVSTDKIITVSTTLNRLQRGVSKVYFDRVWKTFVIIDAGPAASSGQPTVQGNVTDWYGNPIPNAWVYVTQNQVNYMTVTDAYGNYTLGTPPGEPLTTGTWPLTCGDITQNVSIGSGYNHVTFSGVDSVEASKGSFHDYMQEI